MYNTHTRTHTHNQNDNLCSEKGYLNGAINTQIPFALHMPLLISIVLLLL